MEKCCFYATYVLFAQKNGPRKQHQSRPEAFTGEGLYRGEPAVDEYGGSKER